MVLPWKKEQDGCQTWPIKGPKWEAKWGHPAAMPGRKPTGGAFCGRGKAAHVELLPVIMQLLKTVSLLWWGSFEDWLGTGWELFSSGVSSFEAHGRGLRSMAPERAGPSSPPVSWSASSLLCRLPGPQLPAPPSPGTSRLHQQLGSFVEGCRGLHGGVCVG